MEQDFRGLLSIKRKVVLHGDLLLISRIDLLIKVITSQLKSAGFWGVQRAGSDTVVFQGRSSDGSVFNTDLGHDFVLKRMVSKGLVRISLEGQDMTNLYFIKLNVSTVVAFLPYLASMLVFGSLIIRGLNMLLFIYVAGIWFIVTVLTCILVCERIQKELKTAVQVTGKILRYKTRQKNGSLVEAGHRNWNPGELLKTAQFYLFKGEKEKGRHYLALLIEKYPGSEEAGSAFEELKN